MHADDLMAMFDSNNDSYLSLEEFMEGMESMEDEDDHDHGNETHDDGNETHDDDDHGDHDFEHEFEKHSSATSSMKQMRTKTVF